MNELKPRKKIVFVSGTRADFSKIKSLMREVEKSQEFELIVFATGMHLSKQFGLTVREIEKEGFANIYKFINHDRYYQMDLALAHTIDGFAKFIGEFAPDLIVVHGDRVEPLAAALVGILNNILVAHIEGGELSGTVDESLRHAISKLAHIHLVNDATAKNRLMQLGERGESIFIIGSPDLDLLGNDEISLAQAKARYDIDFENYAVVAFHPVVTEFNTIRAQSDALVSALLASEKNYIVIYPNNDLGFVEILRAYEALGFGEPSGQNARFRFFPSIRFEHFIALLRGAEFLIGNSSMGLKEAPYLRVPSINLGSRQSNRTSANSVINAACECGEILRAINEVGKRAENSQNRGKKFSQPRQKSSETFFKLLKSGVFWDTPKQKSFVDLAQIRI